METRTVVIIVSQFANKKVHIMKNLSLITTINELKEKIWNEMWIAQELQDLRCGGQIVPEHYQLGDNPMRIFEYEKSDIPEVNRIAGKKIAFNLVVKLNHDN